jgi:hypothetical protein
MFSTVLVRKEVTVSLNSEVTVWLNFNMTSTEMSVRSLNSRITAMIDKFCAQDSDSSQTRPLGDDAERSYVQEASSVTPVNSRYSSSVNRKEAACIFSSRCLIAEVPGIGTMTGDRFNSQASATCLGVFW